MADNILRLRVDSQEYDNKLKRAAEGLQRYTEGCRKMGGTLEFVEKETLEYVRALGQMGTSATTTRGKLAEMTKSFTEFSHIYNQLTAEEKKGEFGSALNESLGVLRGRIQDSKKELDDINKSINGGGGLTDALDSFAGKLGLNITQLTKFGSVAGVATTALKVAKDAFFQSESNIDEWGRTVKGAEGAYNVFLDTLNNGNWSNFFDNLSKAIQGGRDLYDVFDRLGSIKSNNAAAIAIVQQQIAQLRLAKQQGENVDAQLKAATARLAELQKQSINAGKSAGTKSAFEVIRSGVNSVGGARINDATINYAIDRIMKNGQSEFDKYRYNRDLLQKKGTRTVVTSVDDGYGGTVNKYDKVFDINLLTKEQQKQYALAQAITEGETRIQKGIAAYAQAVQEGTSSAREEFKGNRYALQGSGGGGKGGSSGGSGTNIEEAILRGWQNALNKSNTMVDGFQATSQPSEIWQALAKQAEEAADPLKDLTEAFKALNDSEGDTGKDNKPSKDDKTTEERISKLGSGLSAMASGLKAMGIELPDEINQLINIIQGVSSIIQGANAVISVFSNTAMTANTAALIANTAALQVAATTNIIPFFSRGGVVHAAGGIVAGNTYSGDQIPAMLNAGEVVLNRAQTGALASQLQDGGGGNGRIVGVLRGEDIALVADRWGRRTGKGELAFFK